MVKLCVIGCGGMGNHHAQVLNGMEDVELVGVCDIREDRAQACGEKNGVKWCLDFRELLDEVEVVWICTEPFNRRHVVVPCAEAGKQIFTEKPICNNLKHADEMLAAAKEARALYMLGYVLRFTEPYRLMHDTFASGELGDLVTCWTRRFMPCDMSTSWYGVQEKSGGVMLDFGSHDIDWLRWIGGDVKTVLAGTARVRKTARADEHGQGLMLFENAGMAAMDVSWSSYLSESTVGLIGRKGSIIVGNDGGFTPSGVRKKIGDGPEEMVDVETAMAVDPSGNVGKKDESGKIKEVVKRVETIQEHFFRCLREGIEPITPATDGRKTLATFMALKESAVRGASVDLAEFDAT